MASAGRILILPKGDYDSTKEYEMLDLVFHGGTSWLAKKSSVGVEPSDANTEYWFKMCQSVDLSEIIMRIAALEAKMLGTISLDDIDLTPYALQANLNITNQNVSALTTQVLDIQNIANTNMANVRNLSNSITNLSSQVNGLPTSASTEIVTYVGNGTNGSNNACSVTFSKIVPKVVFMLGWVQGTNSHQSGLLLGGYRYISDSIICSTLTTSYSTGAGFLFFNSAMQPNRYAKKSSDGKTISWYTDGDGGAQAQCNESNYTYYILGIA